jgi:hypothetical protein
VIAEADVGGHDDLDAGAAVRIGAEGKHVQLAEHLQLARLFRGYVLDRHHQVVTGKDRVGRQPEGGFRIQYHDAQEGKQQEREHDARGDQRVAALA